MAKRWNERIRKVALVGIATGGFTGFFPIASGTVGSVVGIGVVWLYRDASIATQVVACLALLALGVWVTDGKRRLFRRSDPSCVVIDEIVGMMITMIGIPVTGYWLAWGFVLFRFLDVVKPPPADYLDARLANGWGVMLDDVVSGIYANIWLHLMLRATL